MTEQWRYATIKPITSEEAMCLVEDHCDIGIVIEEFNGQLYQVITISEDLNQIKEDAECCPVCLIAKVALRTHILEIINFK